MERFVHYLKESYIQIHNVNQIKVSYIERYIQTRLSQGSSKRTLQNEMSAIRQTLRAEGKDKLADHPRSCNHALGLNCASRQVLKWLLSKNNSNQSIYQQPLQKSPALAVTLGLRSEEAVQSRKSMKTWQKVLQTGHTKIQVIFGTKDGRLRDVHTINPLQTLQDVNNA